MHDDEWSASLTFVDATMKRAARINDGSVRYDQVAPGVSLEYLMLSSGLKEDIVVDRPLPAAHSGQFRFQLSVSGAAPVAIDGGTAVALQDVQGREVARIPRGTMTDASGAGGVVDMRLSQAGGAWFVDVVPDLAFLRSVERTYPIKIDPSLGSFGSDTFTDSICGSCNYNAMDVMKAGRQGTNEYYAYVRFPDVTAIRGKTVTNAELHVVRHHGNDPSGYGLTALRTHGTWDASTLNWNRVVAGEGSHGPERVDINANQSIYDFVITSWAQGWADDEDGEWINGKWSPYGATINTTGDWAYYELYSYENGVNRPELLITYTDQSPTASLVYPPAGWTGTARPPLVASFSDPDDSTGSIEFEIQGSGTSPLVPVSNGEAYYDQFPNLAPGTYSWRARAKDTFSYGNWTSYRTFTINSPVVLSDDFTGTNGSVWNATKWTTTANDPAVRVADIQTNEGQLAIVTSSSRATAKMTAARDSEVTLTYRFGDRTLRSYLRLMLRASGATGSGQMPTGYRLELRSDSATVKLQKCIASNCGSGTSIASFTYTMNTAAQNLRFQTIGNLVRVKLWAVGTAEPAGWQIDIPDPGGADFITTPGVFQVIHNFDTGPHSVYLDNVTVTRKSPEENEKEFDKYEAQGEACSYAYDDKDGTLASKYGRACALKKYLLIRGGYGGATGTWKPGCQHVRRGGNWRTVDLSICNYAYTPDGGPYALPYQFGGTQEQLQTNDVVKAEWLWKTQFGTPFGHFAYMTYSKG